MNVIYMQRWSEGSINVKSLNTFWDLFKEGSIYSISGFDVARSTTTLINTWEDVAAFIDITHPDITILEKMFIFCNHKNYFRWQISTPTYPVSLTSSVCYLCFQAYQYWWLCFSCQDITGELYAIRNSGSHWTKKHIRLNIQCNHSPWQVLFHSYV